MTRSGVADELRRRQAARARPDRRPRRSAGSRAPDASIHHRTSRPRYVRGSRTCSPTDNVTRRPDSPDLVGELDARRRCADDEDAAVGKLGRIAVLERAEADEAAAGIVAGKRRHAREIAGATGNDDGAAAQIARRGHDPVAVAVRADSDVTSVCVRTGAAATAAKRRDEVDDLGHRHEAVGIGAVVGDSPAGGSASSASAAAASPSARGATSWRPRRARAPRDRSTLGETAARRQPGMAGTDDDADGIVKPSADDLDRDVGRDW